MAFDILAWAILALVLLIGAACLFGAAAVAILLFRFTRRVLVAFREDK